MEIIVYILFLSVSFFVFYAYRQGVCDSFYIANNMPVPVKKPREEKEKENEFIKDYEKMLNYSFDMAGEDNAE